MASPSEERQWMKAVRKGDFEAFDQLYHAFNKRLYGFLYRLCWNEEDAEDLMQEAFIRLWKNAMQFDLSRPIAPWLYRISHNLWVDRERSRGRRAVDREPSPAGGDSTSEAKGHDSRQKQLAFDVAQAESPERDRPDFQMKKAELEAAVKAALLKLEIGRRAVIVLSFYQGLTFNEIADVLELPIGTVKSRAFYAEKELRESLSRVWAEK